MGCCPGWMMWLRMRSATASERLRLIDARREGATP